MVNTFSKRGLPSFENSHQSSWENNHAVLPEKSSHLELVLKIYRGRSIMDCRFSQFSLLPVNYRNGRCMRNWSVLDTLSSNSKQRLHKTTALHKLEKIKSHENYQVFLLASQKKFELNLD